MEHQQKKKAVDTIIPICSAGRHVQTVLCCLNLIKISHRCWQQSQMHRVISLNQIITNFRIPFFFLAKMLASANQIPQSSLLQILYFWFSHFIFMLNSTRLTHTHGIKIHQNVSVQMKNDCYNCYNLCRAIIKIPLTRRNMHIIAYHLNKAEIWNKTLCNSAQLKSTKKKNGYNTRICILNRFLPVNANAHEERDKGTELFGIQMYREWTAITRFLLCVWTLEWFLFLRFEPPLCVWSEQLSPVVNLR